MFSSKRFIVSGLTFRSLIHFQFIFVYGVRECSNFILLHEAVQFSQHTYDETLFSPLYILVSFVIDQLTIGAWVYLWAFYPVPLIYISVFVPVPYCFELFSLQDGLKSESVIFPDLFFFLKIALAIQGVLCFYTHFRIICSSL